MTGTRANLLAEFTVTGGWTRLVRAKPAAALREAIRVLGDLADDCVADLGKLEPDTLRARDNHAAALGMTGHIDKAVARFEDPLPEYHRIFGASSPDTESAQGNLRRTFRNGEAHL